MRVQIILFGAVILILAGVCLANSKDMSESIDRAKRLQEHRLIKEIAKATVAWLQDQNEPARLEVDRRIDLLLEQDQLSVKSYFIAAQSAGLCENYQKAISILQDVIEKHPDEKAPGFDLPVKIVGRLWLATVAKQSGDIDKAKSVYESILSDMETLETKQGRESIAMICNLYLAEIESKQQNKDVALARLRSVKQPKLPAKGEWVGLYNTYIDWATYEINKRVQKEKAAAALRGDKKTIGLAHMVAMLHVSLSGIYSLPISDYIFDDKGNIILDTVYKRAINNESSKIDRNLSRLVAGSIKERAKSYTEAERYFFDLYQGDSYFSPIGGISLARCKRMENKTAEADSILEQVRTRYPGYDSVVTELKESWKKELR
ncbi:MAG: tetratricopeptide repeat protein [Phycisphaerae bacterium]|nr:tetratricopeptide repeat protein [Phycisphaerae bacterium]